MDSSHSILIHSAISNDGLQIIVKTLKKKPQYIATIVLHVYKELLSLAVWTLIKCSKVSW
jgi:hypothetical protein